MTRTKLSLLTMFVVLIPIACTRSSSNHPGGGTPPTALSYNEVGNGGDFIRILMEEGRLYAAGITARIRADAFPSNINHYLHSGEFDWLIANKKNIEDDIRQSQYVWVDRLPEGCLKDDGCACAFASQRKVYFSQEECQAKLRKRHEAAKLLIHESMHHFVGNDEAKAKRLGTVLFAAWYNMGHPDSPHWKMFSPPVDFGGDSFSVWTGNELLVWSKPTYSALSPPRVSRLGYYNPMTGAWRFERAADFPTILSSLASLPVFASGTAFVAIGGSDIYGYDVGQRLWRSIAPLPLNEPRAEQLVSLGAKLFVHFRPPSQPPLEVLSVGAIYDPESNSWRGVSGTAAPSPRIRSATIWTGDRVMVWGGRVFPEELEGTTRFLNTGALYDPSFDRWTEISLAGAPSVRELPSLAWTGKEVIVFGGVTSEFQITGGAFDPQANRWRPIKNGPLPANPNPIRSRCVWTGTEVLFLNGTRIDSYDPFHNEWAPNAEQPNYPDSLADGPINWTGMEMIGWDGRSSTGYLFYP